MTHEKGIESRVHTGSLGRVKTAQQAEVFGGEGREAEQCDGNKLTHRLRIGDLRRALGRDGIGLHEAHVAVLRGDRLRVLGVLLRISLSPRRFRGVAATTRWSHTLRVAAGFKGRFGWRAGRTGGIRM
jgi:hypothetical protein